MTDLHNSYANARDKTIPLEITPVTGTIGAIVHGVELSGDLPAPVVQAIQAALVRHKVLFFRDQQHLTDQEHEDFAALLGDPVAHPTVPVAEGSRYLLELDSKEGYAASSWHTDVTFVDAYRSCARSPFPKRAATRSGRMARRRMKACPKCCASS